MSGAMEHRPSVGRFGEYSLVFYSHPLWGERMNLGVIVWHPRRRWDAKFISNVSRIHAIDEGADVSRVRERLS